MHTTRSDTSERRFEIQCKLESEIAVLEALKEAEERSRRLTNGVVGILSSLEERLATLRRTILPVYNETGNLQAQQHSTYLTISTFSLSLFLMPPIKLYCRDLTFDLCEILPCSTKLSKRCVKFSTKSGRGKGDRKNWSRREFPATSFLLLSSWSSNSLETFLLERLSCHCSNFSNFRRKNRQGHIFRII